MNKVYYIIAREYLTRVRKRSFIIMSLVGPLLFGLMFVVPIWLSTMEGDEKTIEVVDKSGFFADKLINSSNLHFEFNNAKDLDQIIAGLGNSNYYGHLYIPEISIDNTEGIKFLAKKSLSIEVQSDLEHRLESIIEDMKLERSGLDQKFLEGLKSNIKINAVTYSDSGEEMKTNSIVATAVGYIMSFLLYLFIFLYGVQVMRGVIEEKTNRIVEVIVSSVRPMQLMMGKIIGIGLVSLTQFLIWMVLSLIVNFGITKLILGGKDAAQITMASVPAEQMNAQQEMAQNIMGAISTIPIFQIVVVFILFFVGAYLLYGSLFAGIGSAVDSDAEAQQFQLPVTIPLIFSIVMLAPVLKDPDGSLAFWLSMVPFTSPVIMMMRIPFHPPMWQVVASLSLLYITFLGSVWLAGRVYRIGIFMHGTKVNYKVLLKWLSMKV